MVFYMQYVLTVFLLLFSSTHSLADYISVGLQQAIDNECEKSVKNHEYPNNELCLESITQALNAQGIVSVKRISDEERQDHVETVCVFEKKTGALKYNRCIYEQVYKELGLEIVDPPALVVNVPEEDPKEVETGSTKPEIETTESGTETDTETKVTKTVEMEMPENIERMISQKVIPSTYFIQVLKDNPDTTSHIQYISMGTGSGVAIDTNLVATACHVVTEKNQDFFDFLIVNLIHVNDNALDTDKWFYEAELYAEDFDTDRCIIKVDNLNAQPANLRNYKDLEEFEAVYAVGNPRGFVGKTAKGQITRLYDYVPPNWLLNYFPNQNMELIESNAPIDKGNSGGGLYDSNANLIGIVSMCEILGGPVQCYDEKGHITVKPGPNDQCITYCNKTYPQNFSIPISRYNDLLKIE